MWIAMPIAAAGSAYLTAAASGESVEAAAVPSQVTNDAANALVICK